MEKNIRFVADLKGFSGCKVKIYSENGNYFVRKISKSISYNERLKKQMLKQRFFLENISTERITTPKILGEGFIENLFFFDMEYIQGINLIDHIYNADINELLKISEDLCLLVLTMKNSQREENIDNLLLKIKDKISNIQNKLSNKMHQNIIEELKILTNNLNTPNLKQTFCHGDLTMENVIYDEKNDRYYLIDLLDNFVDHYWFDITKLFQDIEGHWYKFRNPKIDLNDMAPKMNFINNFLKKNLLKDEEIYNKYHYLFLAINFSRILPYASDNDLDYLINIIKQNINKFEV